MSIGQSQSDRLSELSSGSAIKFEFDARSKQMEGADEARIGVTANVEKGMQDAGSRSEREVLRQTIRSVGIGQWQYDCETRRFTLSTQALALLGLDDRDVLSIDDLLCLLPEKWHSKMLHAFDLAAVHGLGWDRKFRVIQPHGAQLWVRSIAEPVIVPGSVTSLIGTLQEVIPGSRHKFQTATSAQGTAPSDREFATIIAHMKQGVSVFDCASKLVAWNEKYLQILDKPEDEVRKGVSLLDLAEGSQRRGDFSSDPHEYARNISEKTSNGETVKHKTLLMDGRIISSVYAPIAGGGFVVTHEDITSQEAASEKVLHAAQHDTLTGLANRTLFGLHMEECFESCKSRQSVSSLILVDLDGFKSVNDTYGHLVGDKLLTQVADRLMFALSPEDFIARLGGDEFAAIIFDSGSDIELIEDTAREIVETLSNPFNIDGFSIKIGASVGIALITEDEPSVEKVISNADTALYSAKANGKACFKVFDARLRLELERNKQRDAALVDVTRARDFTLKYQPIHQLSDNSLVGYEALVRWDSKRHESQSPDEFIPRAEELDLIDEIGWWVIDNSLSEAAPWSENLGLSVNISSRQLGKGKLIEHLSKQLKTTGFSASRLELEITEHALLNDDEATLRELYQLHELGAKIVLDDFGTGYSSMSYLYKFPFSKLKIDRSFVSGMIGDPRRASLVMSIANMAQSLNMDSTAEGIENAEQLSLLELSGCTYGQGYLFGKPEAVSQLDRLRRTNEPLHADLVG